MLFQGNTGDSGSIKSIFHPLNSKGVLDPWSWFIICFMHDLNKCLWRACEAVFGRLPLLDEPNLVNGVKLSYANYLTYQQLIQHIKSDLNN